MLRLPFWIFLAAASLAACGVKAPPIAPESPRPPLNMDCSTSDPECDKTDPNYGK